MKTSLPIFICSSLLSIAIALPQNAFAQAATTPAIPAADAGAPSDIVVTAQKRSERLIDVPLSVTAVSSETLIRQNLVSLRDIFGTIPGLSYNGAAGLQNLAIRGVTTGGGGNPTVAVTIDDVPFNPATFVGYGARRAPDLDPADLDRIEVLRGPQGTLYGASSLGGLIKYVTKSPDANAWHVNGDVGGNVVSHGDDGYSARGSVNVPIVEDHIALLASGFYRRDAGFIQHVKDPVTGFGNYFNDSNETTSDGERAALLVKYGKVSVKLAALIQKVSGYDSPTIEYTPTFGFRSADLSFSGGLTRTPYANLNHLFSGNVDIDLGFAHLTSVTGFGFTRYSTASNTTATYVALLPTYGFPAGSASTLTNNFGEHKFTQEVRIAKQDGIGFDWLIGGFYMYETSSAVQSLDAQSPTSGAIIGNAATFLVSSSIREKAGFADVAYNFSPKFDIQGGVRVSGNDQVYTNIGDGPLNGGHTATTNISNETPVTWLVSPRYHINHDTMVYARVATGYRTGGPNTGLAGQPATFAPDKTINYEVGFKTATADHLLTLDTALYWIDWKNIQLQLADANGFLYLTNGSRARSRGIEATAALHPLHGMTIGANGSYDDAVLSSPLPTAANIRANVGDRLPFSSKWSANLSVDQDVRLNDTFIGYFGATMTYVGDRLSVFQPKTPASTPRLTIPAYTTFSLRAGVRHGGFGLNAYVTNLTDTRGLVALTLRSNANVALGYNGSVITPRTVGFTLSYNY